jgi:hypothetical protein
VNATLGFERRKKYVALRDAKAERIGYLSIVDQSGEPYLYPSQRFVAGQTPSRSTASGPKSVLAEGLSWIAARREVGNNRPT